MAHATTKHTNRAVVDTLRDTVARTHKAAPAFDPLGIVSGLRAYRIYTDLAARTDAELRAMGVARHDLPRVAMDTATRG